MKGERRPGADESAVDATGATQLNRDETNDLVDLQSAFHNLQVRQAEIEAEREQLRVSNARLDESAAHFADLYDFAPIVYLRLDARGRILEANLTAASFFRRERGTLIGAFLNALVVSADQKILRAHIDACMARHVRVATELSFLVRGGPVGTAQMTSVPVLDPAGRPIGCKTVLTDISALSWSREKLQFLNGASGLLGASFDVRAALGQIANLAVPAIADACLLDLRDENGGFTRVEMVLADTGTAGRFAVLRGAAPRIHDGTALAHAMRSGAPLLFADLTAARKDGERGLEHDPLVTEIGPTSLMYVPIVARGAAFGVMTFLASGSRRHYTEADITTMSELATHAGMAMENSRLYAEAQRAIAARQDVLSFVSHDLKNPLMGIMLTADTILRSPPGAERRRSAHQLQRIQRAAQQMRRMIDDLLDMAALEAGRLAIDLSRHDVAGVLEEAVDQFAPHAAAGGVTLTVELPQSPIEVACDRQRLAQVLGHLVDNALKFTPSGGHISISVRVAVDRAVFAVADDGPGIPPDLRPRIFERFAQATGVAALGRGLGLFIARGLVTAQGGDIWVDSPEGAGATFSFTVPLASPSRLATLPSTMEAGDASGEHPVVRRG